VARVRGEHITVGTIRYSVGIAPGPKAVEHAQLAESLGYDRVWLYDSAALYEDIWIWLDRIAAGTETIGIGTAVLVPNLRHVMATASAIATIERAAPGRLAVGFGTGATARWVLGKPALSWATTRRYVEQLRGLLDGEVVEVDGAQAQMVHYGELGIDRPISTPLLLSALGPKGVEITGELTNSGVTKGIFTMNGGDVGIDWHIQMFSGTVLDEGEDLTSERVKLAAGPWYTVMYHGIWQAAPEAVAGLPLGAEWLAKIEAERPEGQRHLAVHEAHVTDVTDRDRFVLDSPSSLLGMTNQWIGDRAGIREKAEAAIAGGATELLYTPSGPDVAREIQAFADAVR
jgi:5,10-methylenetetrahydromethanopterin reductase